MTPRLAVTQEQADWLYVCKHGEASCYECTTYMLRDAITLRPPERPTWACVSSAPCECQMKGHPIPEGTEVEVGWWEISASGNPADWSDDPWHPVAFATLTEVHAALADGQPYRWYVTLSDIKPVEADQ